MEKGGLLNMPHTTGNFFTDMGRLFGYMRKKKGKNRVLSWLSRHFHRGDR